MKQKRILDEQKLFKIIRRGTPFKLFISSLLMISIILLDVSLIIRVFYTATLDKFLNHPILHLLVIVLVAIFNALIIEFFSESISSMIITPDSDILILKDKVKYRFIRGKKNNRFCIKTENNGIYKNINYELYKSLRKNSNLYIICSENRLKSIMLPASKYKIDKEIQHYIWE